MNVMEITTHAQVLVVQECLVGAGGSINLVSLSVEELQVHALPQPVTLLLPATVDGSLLLPKLSHLSG